MVACVSKKHLYSFNCFDRMPTCDRQDRYVVCFCFFLISIISVFQSKLAVVIYIVLFNKCVCMYACE